MSAGCAIAFVVGVWVGFFICALLTMARSEDD